MQLLGGGGGGIPLPDKEGVARKNVTMLGKLENFMKVSRV
jgi:hypothetical protein